MIKFKGNRDGIPHGELTQNKTTGKTTLPAFTDSGAFVELNPFRARRQAQRGVQRGQFGQIFSPVPPPAAGVCREAKWQKPLNFMDCYWVEPVIFRRRFYA